MKLARAASLAAAFTLAACGRGGVVGGECAEGLVACGHVCVDLRTDRAHCGACSTSCGTGAMCSAGACTVDPDGFPPREDAGAEADAVAPTDAGVDVDDASRADATDASDATRATDALSRDADASEASRAEDASDADASDADASDADASDAADGATCAPPFDTASQCGDCATRCGGATPVCAWNAGGFRCQAQCDAPLVGCGAACVDTNSDSDNCGACGTSCATGICQGGVCVGAAYGQIVVTGMDYAVAFDGTPPVTLLANAVLLAQHNPVRVLAYVEHAEAARVRKVDALLDAAAASRGRSLTRTAAVSAQDVVATLAIDHVDVLLVHDQTLAPRGALGTAGSLLNRTLDAFASAGGIIVVLDGGSGAGEMPELLTNAGLLDVAGHLPVTGETVAITPGGAGDAIGVNVATPFLARASSVAFSGMSIATAVVPVVVSSAGDPVVVHRVKTP